MCFALFKYVKKGDQICDKCVITDAITCQMKTNFVYENVMNGIFVCFFIRV